MPRTRDKLILLAGALMLLLPVLALLQFRWLGELSRAESEQLHRSLQATTQQFSEAVEQQLDAVLDAFWLDSADILSDPALVDLWLEWRAVTPEAALIGNLYRISGPRDNPVLAVVRDSAFQVIEWPEKLMEWKVYFQQQQESGPPTPLAVSVPISTSPSGGPGNGDTERQLLLMPVDMVFAREQLFPHLVDRFFADTTGITHDVVVVNRRSGEPIFATRGTEASVGRPAPDVRLGFARPPQIQLSFSGESEIETGLSTQNDIRRTLDYEKIVSSRVAGPDSMLQGEVERLVGGPGQAVDPAWEVRVWPRAGSLASVVATQRRRNLALSFGILGILAGAMVLLLVATRKARRLAARQVAFVAGVSHELRTPLAVIQSAAENLADGVIDEPSALKRYGTLIRDEGKRLSELVEHLLSLAGADTRQAEAAFSPVSVGELIGACVSRSRDALDRAGFETEVDVAEDLPAISGDAAALQSALDNLITNAIKYARDGRWLGIRAALSAGNKSRVAIEVTDRGPGIAEEDVPRLFEPFYRATPSSNPAPNGTGLGLSLVRLTAEAHRGSVRVHSSPGNGATFTLELPIQQ